VWAGSGFESLMPHKCERDPVRGPFRDWLASSRPASISRVAVAAPVQVVKADAVEDDELVGGYIDGTRHPVSVSRRD
jgi:hypothetical protein